MASIPSCPACSTVTIEPSGCDRCNQTGRAHLWQLTIMASDLFKSPVLVEYGPPGTMSLAGTLSLDSTQIDDLLNILAGHPEVFIRDRRPINWSTPKPPNNKLTTT